MPYLMIQNPVRNVPSVELMRMLGASSSRGSANKIGQFGSGFPYALAVLARTFDDADQSLLYGVKICLGKDVYTFDTECHTVKDSSGHASQQWEIRMKKQNGGSWDLNISVLFGAIDWTSCKLAIREFVSNAIDGVTEYGGTPSKDVVIRTDIPSEGRMTRAADGFVRVYIPLTSEIQEYIDEIPKYFRCLSPGYNPSRKVSINTDGGKARVYRKGVLVGQFGEKSLFHYNINDISINESRLVDSYTARDACGKAIMECGDPSIIAKFIDAKMSGRLAGHFEDSLYVSYLGSSYIEDEYHASIKAGIKHAIGERIVCTNDVAARMCESKGYEAVVLDSDLAKSITSYECVKTANEVLNANELLGKIITEPTESAQRMLDYVWAALERCNMTLAKPKPSVRCFVQHITTGAMAGYYRPGDGSVYLRREAADGVTTDGLLTMIHECGHYVTGANDLTHEFCEFAFKFAASLLMERFRENS